MMPDNILSGRPTHILNLDTSSSDYHSSMPITQPKLDAAWLDPQTLRDEVIVETAIRSLEHHLNNPVVDKDHLINALLSQDNLFEFVFSSKLDQILRLC